MKKGTKALVALLLGCGLVLGGCNTKGKTEPEGGDNPGGETTQYTVAISNKTALQADWSANGGGRKVELTVEPKANIAQLISNGTINIQSSNTAVLTIAGQMAMPVAAGNATITVSSGESSDSVAVVIDEALTIKVKYGVDHEGTEDDPLTNEEAISIAKNDLYNEDGGHEDLHVRGIVQRFYNAPGSRTDGQVSFYLEPAQEGGEQFEIFKCFKKGTGEASYLTYQDVWVGADVLVHGRFTVYQGTQAETESATFVRSWGEPPVNPVDKQSTFAEALSVGKALADGADSYDYYIFDAYVTRKSGNDFFLTATKGEAIEDTKTNTIELYYGSTAPAADILAKLKKDAKITVRMVLKNYHGQIENGASVANSDITVVEEGGTWDVIPEPAVEERTLAAFIAGEDTKAKAYYVTATVKSWKNETSDKDQYGNMVLTDGENDLTIYGATATASALAWNNSDAYAFTNPKDFLTNADTAALAKNDTIKMKLIRADFKGAVQGTGIIVEINGEAIGGGGGEKVQEPAVEERTLAAFIAGEDTKAKAYYVTATVKSWKNETSDKDQYGNMVLTDGENDLTIYGATATASALAWNNSDAYAFTNPKDFLTNADTAALAKNDTIKMKLIRADFKGAVQGTGIIVEINGEAIGGGGGGGGEDVNYGTAESPITLAAAHAIASTLETNAVTPQVVYATGVITTAVDNSGSYIKSFTVKDAVDATKSLLVYSCNKNGTLGDPAQNDTITLCGYIKNYNGTLEFTTNNSVYVTFIGLTRGVSQITSVANDSTIDGLISQAANNTEVQFTVTANDGFQIDSVKAYGQVLVGNEGVYQFKVMGDVNVVVSTSEAGSSKTIVNKTVAQLTADNSWTPSAGQSIGTKFTSFKLGDVTVSVTGGTGNTITVWSDGTEMRIYGAKSSTVTMTITADAGYEIDKFAVTYTTNNANGTFAIASNVEDTVNATSKSYAFTVNGSGTSQLRPTAFSVTYHAVSA